MNSARNWIVLLALALLIAPPARADVTCYPSSTTIDFGPYDVLSGATLPGSGTVTVTCINNGSPTDNNLHYTASLVISPARQMAPPSGSDRVTYQLYTDAAHTTAWGDGTGGTATIVGGPLRVQRNGTTVDTFNYYGLVTPGGQDVSAASPGPPPTTYTQTLSISVTCDANGC
jgi:spore coat protein U-like protein